MHEMLKQQQFLNKIYEDLQKKQEHLNVSVSMVRQENQTIKQRLHSGSKLDVSMKETSVRD